MKFAQALFPLLSLEKTLVAAVSCKFLEVRKSLFKVTAQKELIRDWELKMSWTDWGARGHGFRHGRKAVKLQGGPPASLQHTVAVEKTAVGRACVVVFVPCHVLARRRVASVVKD